MTPLTYDSPAADLKSAGIPECGYLSIIEKEIGQPVYVEIWDDKIAHIITRDTDELLFGYMIGHFGLAFKQWWEARHGSECPF